MRVQVGWNEVEGPWRSDPVLSFIGPPGFIDSVTLRSK